MSADIVDYGRSPDDRTRVLWRAYNRNAPGTTDAYGEFTDASHFGSLEGRLADHLRETSPTVWEHIGVWQDLSVRPVSPRCGRPSCTAGVPHRHAVVRHGDIIVLGVLGPGNHDPLGRAGGDREQWPFSHWGTALRSEDQRVDDGGSIPGPVELMVRGAHLTAHRRHHPRRPNNGEMTILGLSGPVRVPPPTTRARAATLAREGLTSLEPGDTNDNFGTVTCPLCGTRVTEDREIGALTADGRRRSLKTALRTALYAHLLDAGDCPYAAAQRLAPAR